MGLIVTLTLGMLDVALRGFFLERAWNLGFACWTVSWVVCGGANVQGGLSTAASAQQGVWVLSFG